MPTVKSACVFYVDDDIDSDPLDINISFENLCDEPQISRKDNIQKIQSDVRINLEPKGLVAVTTRCNTIVSIRNVSFRCSKRTNRQLNQKAEPESATDTVCGGVQEQVPFWKLEVSREQLHLETILGCGDFGVVYRAKWKNYGNVAVKQCNSTLDRVACVAEAKRMHALKHERIVQLLGICTQPLNQPVWLIVELMYKGSLLDFLHSEEGRNLTIQSQIVIFNQISEGMRYLEMKHYVHRDLRAANILVANDGSVKIADFGQARLIDGIPRYTSYSQFPLRWTAPEAALEPHVYSTKSDVWSFGVLMYEVLSCGQRPYPDKWVSTLIDRIIQGYRLPNPIPHTLNGRLLYGWMNRCWNLDPAQRPSFRNLCTVFQLWNVCGDEDWSTARMKTLRR